MKKFKIFVPALLTCVTLFSAPVTATTISPYSINDENIILPLAEEVEWIYRTYNGVLQMRLWSNTQGCWLTDWIDCE